MTKTDFEYISEWHKGCEINEPEFPTVIHRDEAMLAFKLIYEETIELMKAIQEEELTEIEKLDKIFDALLDIRYTTDGAVKRFGFHNIFDKGLHRVHQNNLSKLVDGKVLRREDGKILKPKSYKPVVIIDLIEEELETKFKQAA